MTSRSDSQYRSIARYSGWSVLVVVMLLAPWTGHTEPPPASIDELSWMAGHWAGGKESGVSEEWWTAPAGGVMLGVHRDVRAEGSAFFEYLRIVETGDGLSYFAQPLGRGATEFSLKEIGTAAVLFENLDHDYPQRIGYFLDSENRLVARIEGEVEGRTRASEWRWIRAE